MAGLGKYKKGARFTLKSGNKRIVMAGIGKYKKGAKFTLKSGNKPTFMQMGSSPANLNNFGIGPGGSPYKQNDGSGKSNKETRVIRGKAKKPGKDAKVGERKESIGMKALKIGTTLLSGGLQGVYGGTRYEPKINWGKWTKEELDKSPSSDIVDEILNTRLESIRKKKKGTVGIEGSNIKGSLQ